MILFNHGSRDFRINVGDRVAQLVIEKVAEVSVEEVAVLNTTERNEKGFGSSGF